VERVEAVADGVGALQLAAVGSRGQGRLHHDHLHLDFCFVGFILFWVQIRM
jgi:hypothetical protein